MLAYQFDKPNDISSNPLAPHELPVPEPASGQIRIKIDVCGVCHTDLHTVEGDLELPLLPLTPGHQVVGKVDKLGPKATLHQPGARVGVAWLYHTCGKCDYCLNGLENLCPKARFTGLHANGGYAEYMVVDEGFAYVLPDEFSDENVSLLLCAGIIGYRSLKLSEIKPGARLGLYGFGASAHIAIQVARHWDCEVYVFSRGEHHRKLAEELGASWTGTSDQNPPEKLDSAITFAPVGHLVPTALGHLRPGGTLAVNAVHLSPIPEFDYSLIYEERTLRSVANFARRDATEFLKTAAEIPIKTEVEVFELSKANQVLKKLKESKLKAAAALKIER